MQKVGIIGGIGPESTIEYYRFIIDSYRSRRPGEGYPRVIINSVDLDAMLELVVSERYDELVAEICREIESLSSAGADFAVLASNTPHIVFDDIVACSPLQLISIVEAAADEARRLNLQTVGLFGTRFTMQSGAYERVFAKHGGTVIVPTAEEQEYINEKYFGELVPGRVVDETRQQLITIAQSMRSRDGIEALVLGGTELSLILKSDDEAGMPLLNTATIHVERIVDRIIGE